MMKSFILAVTSTTYILSIVNTANAKISSFKQLSNPNLVTKQFDVSGIPASELQSMYKILTKIFESKNRGGYDLQLDTHAKKTIVDQFIAYEVKKIKLLSYRKNNGNPNLYTGINTVEIELDVILRYYNAKGGSRVTGRQTIWELIQEKNNIKNIIFLKDNNGAWKLEERQFIDYGTWQ